MDLKKLMMKLTNAGYIMQLQNDYLIVFQLEDGILKFLIKLYLYLDENQLRIFLENTLNIEKYKLKRLEKLFFVIGE